MQQFLPCPAVRWFVVLGILGISLGTATGQAQEPPTSPAEGIRAPDGFRVEKLYSVPQDQGSWVSMTVDNRGRLIVSDQYGALYRVTLHDADPPDVQRLQVRSGGAHGLLYAFDSLYVVQNERDAGLYRLRDTDGDDQFDQVERIRRLAGGGEHGPHAIVLGPDGNSLYLVCGNHTNLAPVEASRVPRNWEEDQLLPRMPDANGHASDRMAPGGWIVRMNPDGSQWELISVGYRNAYDLAFNTQGELFTFDADMEWDIGSPWYRPTRICHATSGSEFGWRNGTGKWPEYYIDSLPGAVDIGPGSPTGITFGTGARFPARYQQALFASDWSYGILYAVHLQPEGSSYGGSFEPFLVGAPMPITDLVVHPSDGALYFAVGGRRAPSALYRVTYVGEESTEPVTGEEGDSGRVAELRALRHQLEGYHHPGAEGAVEAAWPYLGHADRFIRYAARVAIEHQPVAEWRERALSESRPRHAIAAAVALARCGDTEGRGAILENLDRIDWDQLADSDRLDLLRAYGLVFMRLGAATSGEARALGGRLLEQFPSASEEINRELARMLVYLQVPGAAERIMARLRVAPSQEEQVHYVLVLRELREGWTPELRRDYFAWFARSGQLHGGNSFAKFLVNIRNEAIENLPEGQREALAELLDAPVVEEPNLVFEPREFVHKWTLEELVALADQAKSGRNYERGREMFGVAQCFKCHRLAGQGGGVGPDLTGVGRRFDAKYILEAITDPAKVISDQYQATAFILKNGRVITGRVGNINGDSIMVMTDMLRPGEFERVRRQQLEETQPSTASMMPTGLLDTLNQEEILDLLAYLQSGGDPNAPCFQ